MLGTANKILKTPAVEVEMDFRDFNNVSIEALETEIVDTDTFIAVHEEFKLFVEKVVTPTGYTSRHFVDIYKLLKKLLPVYNPPKTKATSTKGLQAAYNAAMGSVLTTMVNTPFKKKTEAVKLTGSQTVAAGSAVLLQLQIAMDFTHEIFHDLVRCVEEGEPRLRPKEVRSADDLIRNEDFFAYSCIPPEDVDGRKAYIDQTMAHWREHTNTYLDYMFSILEFSENKFNRPCGELAEALHTLKAELDKKGIFRAWVNFYDNVGAVKTYSSMGIPIEHEGCWGNQLGRDLDNSPLSITMLLEKMFPWQVGKSYSRRQINAWNKGKCEVLFYEWVSQFVYSDDPLNYAPYSLKLRKPPKSEKDIFKAAWQNLYNIQRQVLNKMEQKVKATYVRVSADFSNLTSSVKEGFAKFCGGQVVNFSVLETEDSGLEPSFAMST
jgi:hypothetical protein